MWWAQSLSDQAFWYSPFKKTSHIFKGRTHTEATRKMDKFLSFARITGRFLCVEEGLKVEKVEEGLKPVGIGGV